jgi:hypothetical protein
MAVNPTARIPVNSPVPTSTQQTIGYCYLLVMIVSGMAMLKGYNWARFLYVIISVIMFLLSFMLFPFKAADIETVIIFFIMVFFLFRPKANNFFLT